MRQQCISVLIVDDDNDDYILTRDLLSQVHEPQIKVDWRSSYETALDAIVSDGYDIFLVDYHLGKKTGLELIEEARRQGCRKPMILLTGQGDQDVDLGAIKAGASDYLLKSQIDASLLERSIRYAMDRDQAKQELWKSEEKYRALSENSPDVILQFDVNCRHLYANSAVKSYIDKSPEEIVGRTHAELGFSQEAQAFWHKHLAEVFSSATSQRAEYEHHYPERTGIYDLRLIPHCSADGQVETVMVTMRDITEIKRLQQFTSRAQRLETAGRIAGQVAHDFNNLLGPLVAYPDLMREELPKDHPTLRFLDRMLNAAREMSQINQQLLTLGRRGHYNQEPLNLNKIVRQSTEQLTELAVAPTVKLNLEPKLMNIQGGPAQIFRAVCNLITNACEAMPNGGKLDICTENVSAKEDIIGRLGRIPRGQYVRLTVSDTGPGIPPDVLSRMFDPFFSTKKAGVSRGSGLGLSVVHAVVEDHHGYVECDTVLEQGTSMQLYFPITNDSIQVEDVHTAVGGNEKIMVVDDDEMQREVSTRLLEKLGYAVVALDSGTKALLALVECSPDLLILDMIMPNDLDGTATLQGALQINPHQKAIIVSGYAENERVLEARRLGAGAFIHKPLTLRSLGQVVRRELDRTVVETPA